MKHYYVIGPNENIHCEGKLLTKKEATERAEFWARYHLGQQYFVLEAVSVSQVTPPAVTKAL